ncbi:65-kDa microtubule-associated protein 3-like [Silene latifolia]|uniref:65-kDa microtubule-associated protein 3-like n=1 Tax=Silene latifolia TaxID=37657 RepID=UPI003D773405
MEIRKSNVFIRMETTCESLLYELKGIWDEVGESESGRDKMLMEIEQECLEAYRRKVDQAYQSRAQLRQAIADAEAELALIFSSLGERPTSLRQPDQKALGLKEELNQIIPFLEEMRKRKRDRRTQIVDVLNQICDIWIEIHRCSSQCPYSEAVDETDLSLKRLEELHTQLLVLQKEKSDRLNQVLQNLNLLNCLCLVLGMDFKEKIHEIHPTLSDSKGTHNINSETLATLCSAVHNLKEIKINRLRKLQDLASTMLELWNLMDTPPDEQRMFHDVTSKIAASEDEITQPDCLSEDAISYVEAEVLRLENLKSSKMKDLILKKRSELEEICRQTHMILEENSLKHFAVEAIDFETIDLSYVLEQIEHQISETKAIAFSRKDILERVDKWKAACEEECWLEEYSRDEHRYNGGRGGHLNLRRAEKARVLSGKIPAMVENLTLKTNAWEKEAGTKFLYDGIHLMSMLEDYSILRQEKEKERQRQRDQKKLQGRLLAEQEAIFGSKPSPTKSSKRAPRYSIGGGAAYNRRFSVSGSMLQKQNLKSEKTSVRSHPINNLGNRNNSNIGQVQKKQLKPANTRELGRAMNRDPFSPVNQKYTTPEKPISDSKTPKSNPIKSKSEERYKVVTPIVLTPSTLSATSGTPYTPFTVRVDEVENGGDFEYSFEEIRAGFVLPQRTVKSALQF